METAGRVVKRGRRGRAELVLWQRALTTGLGLQEVSDFGHTDRGRVQSPDSQVWLYMEIALEFTKRWKEAPGHSDLTGLSLGVSF